MRWLIQYIPQVSVDDGGSYSCKFYRCRKCGYSHRYKSH